MEIYRIMIKQAEIRPRGGGGGGGRGEGGGDTPIIFSWGCTAGTLRTLTYTRPC